MMSHRIKNYGVIGIIYIINVSGLGLQDTMYTPCPEKKCHFIFDYNSRISWWIFFINFIPLETGTNTQQSREIYLLNGFMTS